MVASKCLHASCAVTKSPKWQWSNLTDQLWMWNRRFLITFQVCLLINWWIDELMNWKGISFLSVFYGSSQIDVSYRSHWFVIQVTLRHHNCMSSFYQYFQLAIGALFQENDITWAICTWDCCVFTKLTFPPYKRLPNPASNFLFLDLLNQLISPEPGPHLHQFNSKHKWNNSLLSGTQEQVCR